MTRREVLVPGSEITKELSRALYKVKPNYIFFFSCLAARGGKLLQEIADVSKTKVYGTIEQLQVLPGGFVHTKDYFKNWKEFSPR